MDCNSASFGILKMVAEDICFKPQYAFELTHLNINSETNYIIHKGDCLYYLILVFPIEDQEQISDDYECYSLVKKDITDQHAYCLYKINHVTEHVSRYDHQILLTYAEVIKMAKAIQIIGCEVFFASNQHLEKISHDFNEVSYVRRDGNKHVIDHIVNCNPLSVIFFDRLPSNASIRLNGYKQSYDQHLLRAIKMISGYWCLPFYLKDFGANYLVCNRYDQITIQFDYDQEMDVTYRFHFLDTTKVKRQCSFNQSRHCYQLPSDRPCCQCSLGTEST